MGLRERKKQQTRRALIDAAHAKFFDRGFDDVGLREIADAANVSATTLFNYFPTKESLVFNIDEDLGAGLVDAVRDRDPNQSVVTALRTHVATVVEGITRCEANDEFDRLVDSTPALQDYASRMWRRHARALTAAIAASSGLPEDDARCAALACFAVDTVDLACRRRNPVGAVEAIFDLLEHGWAGVQV